MRFKRGADPISNDVVLFPDNSTLEGKFAFLLGKIAEQNEEIAKLKQEPIEMFLVSNAVTVLFMQCGFALLEAGSVRAKNVTNILIKNLLDVFIAAVVYWGVGFAFAFGKVVHEVDGDYHYSGANRFIGHNFFFLTNSWDETPLHYVSGYPKRVIHRGSFYGEWMFNFVFAATATTIISGAIAERVRLGAYFIYSIFASGFIQPVVVHWAWSNGWLLYPPESAKLPPNVYYRDYAGAGCVHAVGGLAALVACIFIGPRNGRFEGKNKYHIPGHSTPLVAIGAFILIIGFLGMVLGHGDQSNYALSSINIVLGGATAGMTNLMYTYVQPIICGQKKGRARAKQFWSFLKLVDSSLCGMVAMCAGCNIMRPWYAALIGGIAGIIFELIHHGLEHHQIDDPIGSFAVHFGGGVTGVLLLPIFADKVGMVYWKGCEVDIAIEDINGFSKGDCLYTPFYFWGWQICGMLSMIVWTIVTVSAIFYLLWKFERLRTHLDTEIRGIDIKHHGEPAYPNAAYGHGWDHEGEFSMDVLETRRGSRGDGRRGVKALMNPNKEENWQDGSVDGGLVEMARLYREKYYKEIRDDSNLKKAKENITKNLDKFNTKINGTLLPSVDAESAEL